MDLLAAGRKQTLALLFFGCFSDVFCAIIILICYQSKFVLYCSTNITKFQFIIYVMILLL